MPIFDRFIRYLWAEHALEAAVQNQPSQSLRPWLQMQGLQGDSARRTANILTHLWFPSEPTLAVLRHEALQLYPSLCLDEHLALHWGMAIAAFPLFHQSVQRMGRLLRLQGDFAKADIVRYVLERYSNQSTIQRAVERIIQSLTDWHTLETEKKRFRARSVIHIANPALSAWLYRALLSANPERHWPLTDLLLAGELFPFEVEDALLALHQDPALTLHRDAANGQTIGLREDRLLSAARLIRR